MVTEKKDFWESLKEKEYNTISGIASRNLSGLRYNPDLQTQETIFRRYFDIGSIFEQAFFYGIHSWDPEDEYISASLPSDGSKKAEFLNYIKTVVSDESSDYVKNNCKSIIDSAYIHANYGRTYPLERVLTGTEKMPGCQDLVDILLSGRKVIDPKDMNLIKDLLSAAIQNPDIPNTSDESKDIEYRFNEIVQFNPWDKNRPAFQSRAEFDMVEINHRNKSFQRFEIKTGIGHPYRFLRNVLKSGYYLQFAHYEKAIPQYTLDNKLEKYTRFPSSFIYASKDTLKVERIDVSMDTLIQWSDLNFYCEDRNYRGWQSLFLEYAYRKEFNCWGVPVIYNDSWKGNEPLKDAFTPKKRYSL